MRWLSTGLFGIVALVFAGLACALPAATAPAPAKPPEYTQAPETQPSMATFPSEDATLPPESTIPAISTPDLSATPPPSDRTATPDLMRVKVFLIAMEDAGKAGPAVGCGDSAVPVEVLVPRTQGVLRAALEKLLSLKEPYFGESGLYNALYQSDLQVDAVRIENEQAVVDLSGTLLLGGECDSPRAQAQLEWTALQFSTVKNVAVFLNGLPIQEALSSK